MLNYALLIVATLISVEIFFRLPVISTARLTADCAARSSRVMQSKHISDHWKERALPMYSQRMMAATLKLAAYIFIVLSPFLVIWVLTLPLNASFATLLTSLVGIGVSMVVAFVYAMLRRQLVRR